MFSKLVLAAAVAIPLGMLSLSGSAMAGYSPTSQTPIARPHSRMHHSAAMSCAAARRMIHANGYRNVVTRECDARTYMFRATRHGRTVVLHVNPRNGQVWRG